MAQQPTPPAPETQPLVLAQPQSAQPLPNRVATRLDGGLEVLHVVGGRLLGSLWMTLFESVQDAIALGLIVKIPNILSQWVLGKQFSGLDVCGQGTNWWSVDRYACFAVVLSDYTLWAVMIPRILYRFTRDLRNLPQSGGSNGST